jgi:hypothetical protein
MNEKQFIEKYCATCGTQRCEGPESEWIEGCKYRENLDDFSETGSVIDNEN